MVCEDNFDFVLGEDGQPAPKLEGVEPSGLFPQQLKAIVTLKVDKFCGAAKITDGAEFVLRWMDDLVVGAAERALGAERGGTSAVANMQAGVGERLKFSGYFFRRSEGTERLFFCASNKCRGRAVWFLGDLSGAEGAKD